MKAIGGFFELELPKCSGSSYHPAATALNTGRACLSVILQQEKPRRVYVPYYTCDSLLEPMHELGIEYVFYALNEKLELGESIALAPDELLIYIDYFGVKAEYAQGLRRRWSKQVVIDNTHAFFTRGDASGWSYNSARKFFGVPDGAYLYGPHPSPQLAANTGIAVDYLVDRLVGEQARAYQGFTKYEASIDNSVRAISVLSKSLLSCVEYEEYAQQRVRNFAQYHRAFSSDNTLAIDWAVMETKPAFCYPLLLEFPVNRAELFSKNIFVPWLWRDTLWRSADGYDFEKNISENLLPLPIDHRYGAAEIAAVIAAVKQLAPNPS